MIRRWFSALARYLNMAPSNSAADVGASIQEEIEFHLEESIRDHVENGMTGPEARRAAAERFGSVSQVAGQCYAQSYARQAVVHRLHTCITLALVVILAALLVTRLWAPATVQTNRADTVEALEPTTAAAAKSNSGSGDIVGRVVDEQMQAIDNAHILAVVKTWPPNGYRQQAYMATTSPDGRFEIANVYPVGEEFEVQIATVADKRLLQSSYLSSSGAALEPIIFRLPPTRGFDLRIERDDGSSIAGAEVFPHRRIDRDGHDHLVYFQSADPIIQKSDNEGVVQLPFFVPGDRATVYLRLPSSEWQTREIVVPSQGNTVHLKVPSGKPSPASNG